MANMWFTDMCLHLIPKGTHTIDTSESPVCSSYTSLINLRILQLRLHDHMNTLFFCLHSVHISTFSPPCTQRVRRTVYLWILVIIANIYVFPKSYMHFFFLTTVIVENLSSWMGLWKVWLGFIQPDPTSITKRPQFKPAQPFSPLCLLQQAGVHAVSPLILSWLWIGCIIWVSY